MNEVHAMTDVTGFGLPWPRARNGAGRGRHGSFAPRRCPAARSGRRRSLAPASSRALRTATGRAMARPSLCPTGLEDWRRLLLTDPQTSGGLLVACDAQAAPRDPRPHSGGRSARRDRRFGRGRRSDRHRRILSAVLHRDVAAKSYGRLGRGRGRCVCIRFASGWRHAAVAV